MTTEERFWSKVDRYTTPDDCWLWRGTLSAGGYALFYANGRQIMAHRFVYELEVGPIPEDRPFIDHVAKWGCKHRHCVKPAHLEPVTNAENLRRSSLIGRASAVHLPGGNSGLGLRTHCKHGHEFTVENTYRKPSTGNARLCRTCKRESDQRMWDARRDELNAARQERRAS